MRNATTGPTRWFIRAAAGCKAVRRVRSSTSTSLAALGSTGFESKACQESRMPVRRPAVPECHGKGLALIDQHDEHFSPRAACVK